MKRGDNCTETAKQQIFRFNPGKELALFPPKHPYYKGPKAEALKQAIDGYTPAEWTPKTIAEAEQFFRDKLGVNCSLKGFTSKQMAQIEAIFRSAEKHFQCYPELKETTQYVGTIQGRVELLVERKFKELKEDPRYESLGDDYLMEYAKNLLKVIKSVPLKMYMPIHMGLLVNGGLPALLLIPCGKVKNRRLFGF